MLELAAIIVLGIAAQWIAWRLKVPAILPLILIGLIVGPLSEFWYPGGGHGAHGHEDHIRKLFLQPIYKDGVGLFPGKSLFYFVSLSIGIILFEGGLTLKREEIQETSGAIGRLISLGSLVTFIGAALAAHYIMDLDWSISFLFSSLIIVTGPTVIAPILQNVPLTRNVATVLKWEGILIDPIGALTAVLVFGFISSGEGIGFTTHAVQEFLLILFVGIGVGVTMAYGLYYMLKYELIPHFLLNVFTLAWVIMAFALSDILAHESGLLTVVIMGIVLANLDMPHIKEILFFKESLSVLLISILFILLAANISLDDLKLLLDWRCAGLFAVVVFVLRPMSVFLSTTSPESGLNTNEKLFVSWVGPRGIVAAGIASLFGLELASEGVPGAEYITPLVFMIVLGTVVINATTAKLIARLLGVIQDSSRGILLVGANAITEIIGKYLQDNNRHVVVVDNNPKNVANISKIGLTAMQANVFQDDLNDQIDLVDIGYLMAMTSSQDVNNFAVKKYKKLFGEEGAYRLLGTSETRLAKAALPQTNILSYQNDFLQLASIVKDYPQMHEVKVTDLEHLKNLMASMANEKKRAPIFLKDHHGINVLPPDLDTVEIEDEGAVLAYMGKELEEDTAKKLETVDAEE